MNRHEHIVCQGCSKVSFTGRCYRCMTCRDFDICADCYSNDFTTGEHLFDHPVMCVYTPADVELYFGGEYISSDPPQSYRCPYCKSWGFNESTFLEHVSALHPNASTLLVSTMVTLFEQQQAARLFLEDEQLACLSAAANSRNEQMRRTVGSLDLFMVPLNPDGSYQRAADKKDEVTSTPKGRENRDMMVRDRPFRVTRRSGGRGGRTVASNRIVAAPRPLLAPGSENNSTNDTSMDIDDDGSVANPRINLMQRSVAVAERIHIAITELGIHSNPDIQSILGYSTNPLVTSPQQVSAANSNNATVNEPSELSPLLNEMIRLYSGDPMDEQTFGPHSGRMIRSRPTNPAPQAASNNGNNRSVYGPTSSFNQAPQNSRSLYMGQDLVQRDDRRRNVRTPNFQGPAGALQRLGPNARALTARSVDFSDLPPEESDLGLHINDSSVENLLRSLNEEPAKVVKQREQDHKRFLCQRFLAPKSCKRPQDNFLFLRAEFVSQLLSSILSEENFKEFRFAAMENISPKLKTLSGSDIAGAGDSEKTPSPHP
ncbi:uncharacterized protein LOC108105842 [Drosophila eugracilis]|uniref:uncharacterized protein LOC108105842 n=1 Tax=Drosophila eugracilis TaxID=29029 RepID=UPI001BDAAE6B|nr:uncharacterized protein LOC108105842 [Drosophila eugracilis]